MKYIFFLSFLLSIKCFSQDTLAVSDLKNSAKLLDVNFTDKEIEMMYPDIKDNLAEYKKMHLLKLDNSVGMSMIQMLSPLPSTAQKEITWTYNKTIKSPNNINDLAFYNINQLGSLLRNKSITSTELTKFFIQRLKKFGDTLHCVVSLTEDIAMQQAKQAY